MYTITRYSFLLFFFILTSLYAEVPQDFKPLALYLTWQKDPTTTMTIQWISSLDTTDDEIQYCKSQKIQENEQPEVSQHNPSLWTTCTGTHHALPEECPYFVHSVEIENLTPNSSYMFRFGTSNKTYLFRTMPDNLDEPLTFIVGGDTYQNSNQYFIETNKQAALQEPAFVIFGGDLAYATPDSKSKPEDAPRWLSWLREWTETMQTPQGYLIPLIVTIGNHEVKGRYAQTPEEAKFFYSLFPMPGLQGYNSLAFDSYLSIILLDSGHTHPIDGAQTEWLEKELMHCKNYPHKCVVYHVPAYPSVRGYRQPYSSAVRRHWLPLFEKYGVNVAFENHDHAYKRTFPLIGGMVHPYGVIYIGDGSWGVKPRIPKKAQNSVYLAKTVSARQFVKVTITKENRTFWAITSDGQIIDHYIQSVARPKAKYLKKINPIE